MKRKLLAISKRYAAALQKHLRPGPVRGLDPALRMGRQAAALGLDTLELARMHEQALTVLKIGQSKIKLKRQAELFFSEALIPIVETHRAGRQSKKDLSRLQATLNHRDQQLATTNRQLQQGIVHRKSVEAALKRNGEHYAILLRESLELQEGLRQLAHRLMTAQEEEKKNISRQLQDQIAQTLLGINVRLISLKQEARTNNKNLKNEIASTQRLVAKSAKSFQRVASALRDT
jgi:signal transduction histidine kinase